MCLRLERLASLPVSCSAWRETHARREARRYCMPVAKQLLGDEEENDSLADEAMIGRIFTPECKQIIYEYDFGDSWEHLVKLERRTRGGEQDHVPQCLAGENAAPPEDSRGIPGYYQ